MNIEAQVKTRLKSGATDFKPGYFVNQEEFEEAVEYLEELESDGVIEILAKKPGQKDFVEVAITEDGQEWIRDDA